LPRPLISPDNSSLSGPSTGDSSPSGSSSLRHSPRVLSRCT
jgi:hypothetical protein